jgi:hypothetical protein
MGLLDRLFGKKQQDAPPERVSESVATLEQYIGSIMSHYGESHFAGDTQAKQILSVYSFGGVSALAMQHQLSPPQAHAVCLALFTKLFGSNLRTQQPRRRLLLQQLQIRHHTSTE